MTKPLKNHNKWIYLKQHGFSILRTSFLMKPIRLRTLDLETVAAAHAWGTEIGAGVGFALQTSLPPGSFMPCFLGPWRFPAYHGPKLGLRQMRTLPCLSGCHPSSKLGAFSLLSCRIWRVSHQTQHSNNLRGAGEAIWSSFSKTIACAFLKENGNYVLPHLAKIAFATLTPPGSLWLASQVLYILNLL